MKLFTQLESNWQICLMLLCSLAIRLAFAPFTIFGPDEFGVYQNGFEFYRSGQLPAHGAAIVYSGTALPGGLQGLVIGLSLYLSQGTPLGAAFVVAILNFLAAWIVCRLYVRIFPDFDAKMIYPFILFAPWTILNTPIWNPSIAAIFSALFFLGLDDVSRRTRTTRGWFLIVLSVTAILQLHLSFLILVFGLLALLKKLGKPVLGACAAGLALGGFTLLPSLTSPRTGGNFIFSNVAFHPENLLEFPKLFLRFLTFATGETTRFVGRGGGLQRSYETFVQYPWLWPFLALGLGISVYLVVQGLRFYIQNQRLTFWDYAAVWFPLVACLLFVFSVKGPSAHTFWVLMPLSFYPIFRAFSAEAARKKIFKTILGVYVLSTLVYSIAGYVLAPEHVSLISVNQAAYERVVAR